MDVEYMNPCQIPDYQNKSPVLDQAKRGFFNARKHLIMNTAKNKTESTESTLEKASKDLRVAT